MAVATITAAELATAIDETAAIASRLLAVASELIAQYSPGAPEAIANEGVIRISAYMANQSSGSEREVSITEHVKIAYRAPGSALRLSGAAALLSPWRKRTAGRVGVSS